MMDMLREYSTPSTSIGHGRRLASIRLPGSEPGTVVSGRRQVTDAQVQAALAGWIAAGTVPAKTANTLYFVYLPIGTVVVDAAGAPQSCTAMCGYHGAFGASIYYAVIPYANCNGCEFPGGMLDTFTEVSSHELCEAVTDPALHTWWDSGTGNEIGDICNRDTVRLGGYLVQTEWSNRLGVCTIGTTPASVTPSAHGPAVSWSANRLDLFGIGTDNALYHMAWDGSNWSAWEKRGGTLLGPPKVVSWGPNRLDVFGIGTDNALYHMAWDGSNWSAWEKRGGVLIHPVDAVCWGPNRIDIFGIGTDNALYHMAWNSSNWSAWEKRGGTLMASAKVVAWGPNRLDVFGIGTDNALYHMAWDGSVWSAWEKRGGVLVGF